MEETIFEKIVAGEIPSFKIWDDDDFYAFLDINPLAKGHTLVIPKKNVGDYIFDLSSTNFSKYMSAARKVAKILEEKINCVRVLMFAEGFDVPHMHIHLVPAPSNEFSVVGVEPVSGDMEELREIMETIVS